MDEIANTAAERRFAKRYETKDVLVYIRYLKQINWFRRFNGPFLLDDIAIIGKKADLFEKKYEYVVQFNPYGKGIKYNSFSNKEKLEKFFKSIKLNNGEP